MKHLFVSPERIAALNYRHALLYRAAALLILLTCLLQVPGAIFGVLLWRQGAEEQARHEILQARLNQFSRENAQLDDPRQKLNTLHQWEKIMRSRIPISALLGAIENSIPADAVLNAVSIETDQFSKANVSGGTYRIPTSYRLLLEGVERDPAQLSVFADNLMKRLPGGSEVVRAESSTPRQDKLIPFLLQLSVKPSGAYRELGIRRITDPEKL